MAERDKSETDVAEQERPATNASAEGPFEAPEDLDERPEADAFEQAVVVEEDQIRAPAGSREEAADADWIEQSVEVPLVEGDEDR